MHFHKVRAPDCQFDFISAGIFNQGILTDPAKIDTSQNREMFRIKTIIIQNLENIISHLLFVGVV